MSTTSRGAFLMLLLTASGAVAQPFGASGPEFRVNTTTTGYQDLPSVGMDAAGSFLVLWKGGRHDLRAQRYSPKGAALGGEFRVNSYASEYPYYGRVAGGTSGAFVIVWSTTFLGGEPWIEGQRYQDGAPLGGPFRVDAATTSFDQHPDVARNAAGDFVVVWGRSIGPSNNFDLYGQVFGVNGAPQGTEFHVTSETTNQHAGVPSVTRRDDGGFLVAWTPNTFPAAVGRVFVARYSPPAASISTFIANTDTNTANNTASVAYDGTGRFVVAWGGASVWTQRYAADAAPLGIFRVDTGPQYPPIDPRVATDAAGNFVVTWVDNHDSYKVLARRFASSGAPLGEPFRVDGATGGTPRLASVAMNGSGDFVVTWQRGDYPNADIYARRFCATVAGDANGDGAIDVLDAFYLINRLFAGGPAPLQGSDVNGDGAVDVLDVFFLINMLFAGGPAPVCA